MTEYQITCIKQAGGTGHEHIVSVGVGPARKFFTVVEVITMLRRMDRFFVSDGVNKAYVQEVKVMAQEYGYIRTFRDRTPTDNLLSLPQCP